MEDCPPSFPYKELDTQTNERICLQSKPPVYVNYLYLLSHVDVGRLVIGNFLFPCQPGRQRQQRPDGYRCYFYRNDDGG